MPDDDRLLDRGVDLDRRIEMVPPDVDIIMGSSEVLEVSLMIVVGSRLERVVNSEDLETVLDPSEAWEEVPVIVLRSALDKAVDSKDAELEGPSSPLEVAPDDVAAVSLHSEGWEVPLETLA